MVALLLALWGSTGGVFAERRVEVLTSGWRLALGTQENGANPGMDDSAWKQVTVPHDWAISSDPTRQGENPPGMLNWRGEGWYRRWIDVPADDATRRVYLLFDGVMAQPEVFINGQRAAAWDYGYNSFWVDATQHIEFGKKNLLAVRVDTREHESDWYPGAGIYRKVSLHVREMVHAENWGANVQTTVTESGEAQITVRNEVRNHLTSPQDIEAELALLGPGDEQRVIEGPEIERKSVPAQGAAVIEHTFKLKDFQAWGIGKPNLYKVRLRILQEGEELDRTETTFGIRKITFTAKYGFYLNDKRVQIRGVNLLPDLGPLGAAFHADAMLHRLEMVRDMGVNAIRVSGHPPAPELLDMCDKLGLLVFAEGFAKWDAHVDLLQDDAFETFMRRNVANFIRRDRNHPSVIAWSMGSEVYSAEQLQEQKSLDRIRFVVDLAKQHDPSRPITMAWQDAAVLDTSALEPLDLVSWNYGRGYDAVRRQYPDKPTVYSQAAADLSTRGYYRLPHPEQPDAFDTQARQVDSYDLNAAPWSDPIDVELARMEVDRFCSGIFLWTAFDFLGQPFPFDAGWAEGQQDPSLAARSSYTGAIDLCDLPKDRYYLLRSCWAPGKTTVHILPHWTWPGREGKPTPVYVYTNADEVELFLNGKSLGRRQKSKGEVDLNASREALMDRYRLRWEEVPYEPGELSAVAFEDGKEIGSATARTAGEGKQLRLLTDRKSIPTNGESLCYLLVDLVDGAGTLCPHADNPVRLQLTGPAEILGVANGNPLSSDSFTGGQVRLFHGKAMVILRCAPKGPGAVRLVATADGVEPATIELKAGE
ncbi:MAG: DUF4982 domain-containing protein [Planctomycetales bacterium]|nr:DUF4982 domain-containing protein [Planctomycetales bacterium]